MIGEKQKELSKFSGAAAPKPSSKLTAPKLNVVILAGGRGSATICEAMSRHSQIHLSILVNAYDDGLSTGKLRDFIPGLLGPSDIRKNVTRLMTAKNLQNLLEYRFPVQISYDHALEILEDLKKLDGLSDPKKDLLIENLTLAEYASLTKYLSRFISYLKQADPNKVVFSFSDCSFGNLVFAGCFLDCGRSFNKAIKEFSTVCRVNEKVLNVTDGENLVLVGLKEDGTLLEREADIVSRQNTARMREIFLLRHYFTEEDRVLLSNLSVDEKVKVLRQLSVWPKANPEALSAIRQADVIIYGPGTQHSSLFPSYFTQDFTEAISQNSNAEKIFIANILKDHEIQSETANSLVEKFLFYMGRKNQIPVKWSDVITQCYFQTAHQGSGDYVPLDLENSIIPVEKITVTNWEASQGVHSGGRVLDEILAVVNRKLNTKLKSNHHMVSIVVPGLNEERTVKTVLHELSLLDFESLGAAVEIIYVDGGSADRSVALAKSEPHVRVFELQNGGRGEALRYGIQQAQGNLIIFFPSDGEYDPKDLIPVATSLIRNEFSVVFGSRAIKCVDLSKRIKDIYRGNWFGYFVGKYGGMVLSVLSLMLYNRFISDAFTSIKAFDARLLKSLNLVSSGVDLECEIIAKLSKRGTFIMELPVEYRPRKKSEGKKTTVLDGIKALLALFKFRYI